MKEQIKLALLLAFAAIWIALGIDPSYREDWLLENVLVLLAGLRGAWSYLFPLTAMMSLSLVYELIEWAAALVFGGDLGMAYLGTQGDEWDAHKDMACAALASLVIILLLRLGSTATRCAPPAHDP